MHFSISQYAPDGELLLADELSVGQLSSRWLQVCRDLLDVSGPVFSRAMGGSLEKFAIECAGPMCRFKAYGTVLYSTVLLTGSANTQQAVDYFAGQLAPGASFTAPDRLPAFLVLNTLAPGIEESDRAALFQLACHFAGAYFESKPGE